VGLLSIGVASPASAVGGYTVAQEGLALRAQPNASATLLRRYSAGQALDIECQTTGQNINGSAVWDKIAGTGGYVSDFYVNGTPFAVFDSRIPRCSSEVRWADLTQACRWQYRNDSLIAQNLYPWNDYSWLCWAWGWNKLEPVGGIDVNAYCARRYGASTAYVTSRWYWYGQRHGWACS
jgi:hypothetical protein